MPDNPHGRPSAEPNAAYDPRAGYKAALRTAARQIVADTPPDTQPVAALMSALHLNMFSLLQLVSAHHVLVACLAAEARKDPPRG